MTKESIGSSVRIENLCKRFGDVVAVDDVSLTINAGEFVSLLGSSGSGKTTTLMIVAGFAVADKGTVQIAKRQIDGLSPEERGLGVVFQSYALFPHMNVADNIGFPLRMRGKTKEEISRRVGEALEMVELGHLGARKVDKLSGGQQQRVALARALVFEPPVLLLDEPLGALDRKLRDQLQTEIKRIQVELGITVLYVTHDQEEALSMSDRIAVMSEGRIEQIGSPDDVYEAPCSVFVASFLGESNFFDVDVDVDAGEASLSLRAKEGGIFLKGTGVKKMEACQAKAMVRPEMITLGEGALNCDNSLDARVILREHLGSTLRLTLQTPLGQMTAKSQRTGPAAELRPGDQTKVGWNAKDFRVFPE